jgi:uncharacterized membrane protein YvbJ
MKETLAEYARIIIVMISFALVCVFILGGTWFQRMGTTLYGIENDLNNNRQQTVLDLLENREKPTLIVKGASCKTGEVFKLLSLVETATTKAEDGTTDISIKDRVVASCDSKDFDAETQTIKPTTAGIYTIKYTVKDDYGFSATVIVKLIAND